MPDRLTIALTYYDNPAMLREQQRVIAEWPTDLRSRLLVIVADDGSPNAPADEAMVEPDGYEMQVYRIIEDKPWHHLGARNLAMHEAPEGWCLRMDIDHALPAASAAVLFGKELDPACHYIPSRTLAPDDRPHTAHTDTFLLTREMYWRAGGSDESLTGIYGGGSAFRHWVGTVGRRAELPDVALRVYNLGGIDIGGVTGAATRAGRKGSQHHWKRDPEKRRLMDRAHRVKPSDPLRFRWERVR